MKLSFKRPTFKEWGQPEGNKKMQTSSRKKAMFGMAVLFGGFVLLAGSATGTQANDNKINGKVPTAPTKCLIDSDLDIMSFENFNGKYVRIEPGVRASGTRSPVHSHPYGGSTCVLEGEMTLTLEGEKDQTFRGNLATRVVECYPMPPPDKRDENKMAATNTGSRPALIIDIFTVPEGRNPISFDPMCVLQTGNPACYITGSGCE